MGQLPTRRLNKLDALHILANAYYYLSSIDHTTNDVEAAHMLYDTFHRVRRSTTVEDLESVRDTEGWNGRGTTWL